MNHPAYIALSPKEQFEFVGKLIIAVQQNEFCYKDAQGIVQRAESSGVYETTKVHADSAALADIATPIDNGIITH